MSDQKPKPKAIDPDHYANKSIEPIDVIEDWGLGFNHGNCIKYIARQGDKGELQHDLMKIANYAYREATGLWLSEQVRRDPAYVPLDRFVKLDEADITMMRAVGIDPEDKAAVSEYAKQKAIRTRKNEDELREEISRLSNDLEEALTEKVRLQEALEATTRLSEDAFAHHRETVARKDSQIDDLKDRVKYRDLRIAELTQDKG